MTFSPEQTAALKAPLDPKHVADRQQGGGKVQYIEGWHAIAEANRIFGFGAWMRETVELRQLGEPVLGKDRHGNDQWRANYMARVRITVHPDGAVFPVIRDGCGFGQGIDKDVGQAHESALKEAETDAMKRALMTFGNPFGLALYDKSRANVAAPAPEPVETITEVERGEIIALAEAAQVQVLAIIQAEKIADLRELPARRYDAVKRRLNLTIDQKKAA